MIETTGPAAPMHPPTSMVPAELAPPAAAARLRGCERLLLVDDEPFIRAVLRRVLTAAGVPRARITEAGSAEEALPLLEGAGFDLVLSDFRMGRMNGIELLGWVREHQPAAARLLMTGYNEGVDTVQGVDQARPHGLVKKPWDNDALLAELERALGERDAEAPRARGGA